MLANHLLNDAARQVRLASADVAQHQQALASLVLGREGRGVLLAGQQRARLLLVPGHERFEGCGAEALGDPTANQQLVHQDLLGLLLRGRAAVVWHTSHVQRLPPATAAGLHLGPALELLDLVVRIAAMLSALTLVVVDQANGRSTDEDGVAGYHALPSPY